MEADTKEIENYEIEEALSNSSTGNNTTTEGAVVDKSLTEASSINQEIKAITNTETKVIESNVTEDIVIRENEGADNALATNSTNDVITENVETNAIEESKPTGEILQAQTTQDYETRGYRSRQISQRSTFQTPLIVPYYQYKDDKKTFAEKIKLDKAGWWFWIFSILLPIALLTVFYGLIPLPPLTSSTNLAQYWVFSFVITPISWTIFGYFYMAIFLVCMGVDRPFRVRIFSVLAPFLATMALANIITVTGVGTIPFFGIIMYAVTLLSVFGGKINLKNFLYI